MKADKNYNSCPDFKFLSEQGESRNCDAQKKGEIRPKYREFAVAVRPRPGTLAVRKQCLTFGCTVFNVLGPHWRGHDGCQAARAPDGIPNL